MKKIISLGIASAVLAMTAISASAGVVVRTDDKVNPNATITVSFVADADCSALSFKTTATGATLVDASAPNAGPLVVVGTNKDSFVSLAGAKANDVVFTQTYKVTAAADEQVSITVTDLEGTAGVTPLSVKVEAAGTSTPSDPSSTPSTPSDPSSTPSDPSKPTDPDNNPGTGVALAVFPAVIAGAAVVVAKKKRG